MQKYSSEITNIEELKQQIESMRHERTELGHMQNEDIKLKNVYVEQVHRSQIHALAHEMQSTWKAGQIYIWLFKYTTQLMHIINKFNSLLRQEVFA